MINFTSRLFEAPEDTDTKLVSWNHLFGQFSQHFNSYHFTFHICIRNLRIKLSKMNLEEQPFDLHDKLCFTECGEPFQAWEMWLSPHLENQWGARLAGRTHVHG